MEPLLTVGDVAKKLAVSKRSVWKLLSLGQLPKPVKILSSSRWREADINAFIDRVSDKPKTKRAANTTAADKSLSQE